jgi:Zn-dependent protease
MGSLFGVPIRVAPAVFLMAAIALVSAGPETDLLALFLLLVLLAASLLAHELAHALVARHLGLRVLDITIWPLGGMARMEGLSDKPMKEAAVAASGPLANLILAGLFALIPSPISMAAVWLNLVLGLGNLLPIFPLDGGRILRAWLARRSPLVDATLAANRLAKVLALFALLFSLYYGMFLLGLLLAGYLWWSGQMELAQVMLLEGHGPSLPTSEVWRRACYPWLSSGQPPPSSHTSTEDLEDFHGSLDEFFHDRDSR